jgi:hypothetical protein
MLDWTVILTPLLVLGVVLLLGYAGCTFDPSSLGPVTPHFDIVLRVGADIGGEDNVTAIIYSCTPPGGPEVRTPPVNPDPDEVEGADTSVPVNVYRHSCGTPVAGTWNVACTVTVSVGPTGDTLLTASAEGDVTLDSSDVDDFPEATFSAGIFPGGDFRVAFVPMQA